MSELIRSSLIWRTVAAIAAWFSTTAVARALGKLRACWQRSGCYRLFARLLTAPPAVEKTGFHRLLQGCNRKLCSQWYARQMETSVFRELYGKLLKALRSSLFVGKIFQGGMVSFLLFLIAAYWPVDYLLRDVLKLEAISSVWDEAMIALGFLWLIHRRVMAADPIRSRLNSADLALSFYLLTGLVLLMYTCTKLSINITGYRASMQYILIFFLVVRLIRDDRDFRLMYDVMVLFATVFALHGLYQFVVGAPIPENWTDQAETAVRTRVYSIFSNPNIMGAYMILFAPMTIARAYETEDTFRKVFFWGCGLCMCLATLFTMSRGAWLALALAAVFFALIVDRRLLVVMLVAGVAACFLPFVRSRITYLFTADFAASNARAGRGKRWSTALGYLDRENAWAGGLGYGIFGGAVAMQNQVSPQYEYMYVDNYYVKILTENGLIGLVSFLLSMVGVVWTGCRAAGLADKKKKPLCVGMLAGLLGILAQSFFESIWEEPYMMALFFAVAGMMVYEGFFSGAKQERENGL